MVFISFFVFVFAFLAFLFIIYSIFNREINLHVNKREFATQNWKSSNNRKYEQVNIQRATTVSFYNEFLKASLTTTERFCVSASIALWSAESIMKPSNCYGFYVHKVPCSPLFLRMHDRPASSSILCILLE